MKVGNEIVIRADGSGEFSRVLLSAPNVIASGTHLTASTPNNPRADYREEWIGFNTQVPHGLHGPNAGTAAYVANRPSWLIDTGINADLDSELPAWKTSSELQYSASASISGGLSQNGGLYGITQVSVVVGDGLFTSGPIQYGGIDQRIYIMVTFIPMSGNATGKIKVSAIDWKLVQL